MYSIHRRYLLLLEVLIALAIISLCLLPLITPHVLVYKIQKEFTQHLEMGNLANRFYGDILEQLHKNEIPWQTIQDKVSMPLESLKLREGKNNYEGTYQFHILEKKVNQETGWGVYHVALVLSLRNKNAKEGNRNSFKFSIPLIRHIPSQEIPSSERMSSKGEEIDG